MLSNIARGFPGKRVLLYLAGISKKDPLKKVLLYHYFDTVEKLEEVNMNRPEEMPKWYSFLNLKNIIGN